ncbi:hypothetical protein AVT69_gp075 [Pseudomonas phage PhiPA3]|uniref:Uncharacterized protein 076 n=1 Tax=Pseudomonas phage PhiPA3 TaxID=998086 RepID=F8SJV5_BPPA3|nr:hypothetical protein AVT69_gp075 [Pseudomonas phage PhiPA3]AEH03500.1 hypothetical protein [Pseudomonas phage PhiPA3]
MQEILDSVLTPLIADERKEAILDCVASFEELDFSPALDELHTVCMIADDMADTSILLSRIDDVIRVAHDQILSGFEIRVSDEATQVERQAILKTVTGIAYYILPDDIQGILQSEYDHEETLAHLVPLFENVSVDDILPLITYVAPSFIEALTKHVNEVMQVRGVAQEYDPPVERIKLINQLLRTFGHDKFQLMLELSSSGMRVGGAIDQLMSDSMNALDSRNAKEALYEIVGLVFFSNVTPEMIWKTANMLTDEYTENPMERAIMLDELRVIQRRMPINETA